MTQGATVYFDVDGVINAVKGGRNPDPGAGGWDEWRTIDRVAGFPISYAPEMLRRIEAWAALPGVEVVWLTTWEDQAPTVLCPAIGLDGTEWRVLNYRQPTPSTSLGYRWWKQEVMFSDWETHNRPFVWVDDDLAFEENARYLCEDIAPDSSLLIAPNQVIALTRDDVEKVDNFLAAHL